MQGKKGAVVLALDIICTAVDRYKELCEGNYNGELPYSTEHLLMLHPVP